MKTVCLISLTALIGCTPDDPYCRDLEARVTSLEWTRTVELQKRVVRHAESWRRQMPAGAFNAICSSRQNGYYDCNPYVCGYETVPYPCGGYECGCYDVCDEYNCWTECDWCDDICWSTEPVYCYRSCPRYEDWCSYDYEEWQVIDRKVESGQGHDAVWPQLTAGSGERLVQSESYRVTFGTDKSTYMYEADSYSDYNQFELDAVWSVLVCKDSWVEPISPSVD